MLAGSRSNSVEVDALLARTFGRKAGHEDFVRIEQGWDVLGEVRMGDTLPEELLTDFPEQRLDVGQIAELKIHLFPTWLVAHLQLKGEHLVCNIIPSFMF